MDSVRADRWLWAARLFETRSAATAACRGGHVRVNGSPAEPASRVHPGDRRQLDLGVGPHEPLRPVEEVQAEDGGLRALVGGGLAGRDALAPTPAGRLDRVPDDRPVGLERRALGDTELDAEGGDVHAPSLPCPTAPVPPPVRAHRVPRPAGPGSRSSVRWR